MDEVVLARKSKSQGSAGAGTEAGTEAGWVFKRLARNECKKSNQGVLSMAYNCLVLPFCKLTSSSWVGF